MTDPFTCPAKNPCASKISEIMRLPVPTLSAVLMCRACRDEVTRRFIAERVVVVSRQEKTYKPPTTSIEQEENQ